MGHRAPSRLYKFMNKRISWLGGSVVERWSLTGELSLVYTGLQLPRRFAAGRVDRGLYETVQARPSPTTDWISMLRLKSAGASEPHRTV